MKKYISILDYGMGNIFSIKKAFDYLNIRTIVTNSRDILTDSYAIILPGVGSFKSAIKNLIKCRLLGILENLLVHKKRPFLGICLGMQLLFKKSTEDGGCNGMGIFDGCVERFSSEKALVPQIGWNKLMIKNNSSYNFMNEKYFYFVHSYFVNSDTDFEIIGITSYNVEYISFLKNNNITCTQFHPEKSSFYGLKFLKEWSKLIGY